MTAASEYQPAEPVEASSSATDSSATVAVQLWLSQSPWRPTAGWAVVAALFAYGLSARPFFVDWRMVALVLLLADPLWGSIWRLAGGRYALLPLPRHAKPRSFWLPYLQPGSPAARILGAEEPGPADRGTPPDRDALPLLFRVALPTLLLPPAVGWVLGAQALWMTAAVIVISALGWISRRFLKTSPAILQSLVTVTLPWILMLSLLGISRGHEMFGFHALLLLAWTIHHWGEVRVTRWDMLTAGQGPQAGNDRLGIGLLALADLSLAGLLIAAQAPLWLAPLAVLWLPTYLTLYQKKGVDRLAFWWLAAMLLSSAAIGSRM